MAEQKKFNVLQFALIFAIVYLGSNLVFAKFFPQPDANSNVNGNGSISLKAIDDTVKGGHHPTLTLKNKSDEDLVFEGHCPMPPLDVFLVDVSASGEENMRQLETEETALPCENIGTVEAGKSVTIDLGPWKYSLFDTYGVYEVRLPATEDTESVAVTRFSIHEAGTITQIFRTFITKPLLNALIYIASLMPGYNLGLAIIILTVIIKVILFFPTQRSMEGQKRMQEIQPKLEAIKQKYKDDAHKVSQETMKVWKENNINPLQSCLPILLQFPILIGLFFTIRDGSILALSEHLLYEQYQNLSWTFGTDFLGLDLLKPSIYILPPLLVVMQFLQLKLSFAISKRKQSKEQIVDVSKDKKKAKPEAEDMQQMQQKVMLFGLPLMIGFFALRFEAAVSLYWGISTLFAIGQQVIVNRKYIR